ncbi:MAG: tetratricopeptide repeat protein [Sarcina sp.]
MTKIKIKVKYIIYLALTILLVIPNIIMGAAALAYNYDIKNTGNIDEIPKGYYFQGLLNLYVNMPKISPFEDVAYYYMGVNEYNYKTSPVTFGVNVAMGSNGNVYFNDKGIANAIEYHKKGLKEGQGSSYYIKNFNALMGLYFEVQDFKSAQELIDSVKHESNDLIRSYAYLNEGAMYLKQGGYDKAIKSFEKMGIKTIASKNAYIGDAYKLKGDNKKANKYYELDHIAKSKKLDKNASYKDDLSLPYMNKDLNQGISYSKDIYQNIISDKYRGSVEGKFIYNGVPMTGATIYLSKEEILYLGNPGEIDTSSSRENIYAYVQEDGSFKFNNIPEGKYYVSMALPRSKYVEADVTWSYINNNFVKVSAEETSKMEIIKKLDENDEESFYVECNNIDYENLLRYDINPKRYGYFGDATADENMINFKVEENGKEELPARIAEMLILEDCESLDIYKMFSEEPTKGSFEQKFLYKGLGYRLEPKEYFKKGNEEERDKIVEGKDTYRWIREITERHTNLFQNIITEDEARVEFPSNIVDCWRGYSDTYAGVSKKRYETAFRYYEEEYLKNPNDIMNLQILIKYYITGYGHYGEGKDVTKALELSDELYQLVGSKSADMHLKEFIIRSYSIFSISE